MEKLTVSHTYGQALFDAAADRGKVDGIGEEYEAVTKVFADNPMLKKFLVIPNVPAPDKRLVAEKIFGGRISQELLNFMLILIDKRRIAAWDGIGRQYEKLVLERDGVTKGILYSAVPVDKERLASFERKAGAAMGKRVRLESRVDKSLIGGVRIYVDGKLIDASLRSRLENLKQILKHRG